MATLTGIRYVTIRNEQCTRCIPETVYRPFPSQMCKAAGKMILEIEGIPSSCFVDPRPKGLYWWTDGQVTVSDEGCIYVTCEASRDRTNFGWLQERMVPAGLIMRVSLQNGKNQLEKKLYRSKMPDFPKLQIHPSGQYIGYVGCEGVKITTLDHKEVYNKPRNLQTMQRFMAFSPDGQSLAILHCSRNNPKLLVSSTSSPLACNSVDVNLRELLPTFGRVFGYDNCYGEHLECKWSPDSQYIAICSSVNDLFVLSKKLELHVVVSRDILPSGADPKWGGTFDYDPRYCHDMMAVGCSNRRLYVVSMDRKAVVLKTDSLSEYAIDCVVYSPNGEQIAVSFRDFKVFLLDSCSGAITFSIDMKEQCNAIKNTGTTNDPSVMRLCFSCKGEQLVTSTCDGMVRVWQLPRVETSLFGRCKWEILRHVPASKLKCLPLPQCIKDRLMPLPVPVES